MEHFWDLMVLQHFYIQRDLWQNFPSLVDDSPRTQNLSPSSPSYDLRVLILRGAGNIPVHYYFQPDGGTLRNRALVFLYVYFDRNSTITGGVVA